MAYSLTYSYDSTNQSYSVTGWSGITTSDKVVISSTHDDGTNGSHPVTSIGEYAFEYCSSLTSITIPDSVTSIGKSAFYYCTSLTSVTIPDSVTSIGQSAFKGCSSLESVTIGDSVTSISDFAFSSCSSLTSITIPNSVTSIGYEAFYDCTSLTSVTIGDGVTSIGDGAFVDCSSLTSVTIGNGVTSIGNSAFSNCSSLTSITIPNSVTSINEYAFNNCRNLTSVTIPDSVMSIGDSVFHGCSSLTQLILFPLTPPTLGSSAIPSTISKIYVQQSSEAAYQVATNWTTFASKIVSDNIYLSFVRFNQKNKEHIDKKISDKLSTSNIGQGLSFSDNKINANIAKIQDADANEFTPDANGVVTIPAAQNGGRFGLFTSRPDLGLDIFGDPGWYYIVPADENTITARGSSYNPLRPATLNFAVKAALTDDKRIGTETSGTNTAFTDTEKDRACEILGASRKLYKHFISAYDPDEPYGLNLTLLNHKSTAYSNATELVSANLEDWGLILYACYDGRYSIGNINATASANEVNLSAFFLWNSLTEFTVGTLRIHSGLTNFADAVTDI